jgi:hypothetical protein
MSYVVYPARIAGLIYSHMFDVLWFFHNVFIWIPPPYFSEQTIFFHNPDYFLVIHLDFELHLHRSPAIFAFTAVKYFFNEQVIIVIFFFFVRMFIPLVVSALGNFSYLTQ